MVAQCKHLHNRKSQPTACGVSGHIAGVSTDALDRIGESRFYDLTERDSVIIVSELSDRKRKSVWVEDKTTKASDYLDVPAFVIGSEKADKLGGAAGNDYIEGLGGDYKIRTGLGADVVDGGAGSDKRLCKAASKTGKPSRLMMVQPYSFPRSLVSI